jgi:hypothetical protein
LSEFLREQKPKVGKGRQEIQSNENGLPEKSAPGGAHADELDNSSIVH